MERFKGLFWLILAVVLLVLVTFWARDAFANRQENDGQQCQWQEWQDTTRCQAVECGTQVGIKGQERECTIEVNEYSCPVVHWVFPRHIVDVPYEKSQDPTKCHRPSDNDLRTLYGMGRSERNLFKFIHKEWKNAEISGSHIDVIETQARRTECRIPEEQVEACGTIRWCFPSEGEHEFEARAIPNNEQPKEGFAWETGMDKWCEYPPKGEPTPTPEPERHTDPSTITTPVCPDGHTAEGVANAHVLRNGSEATVNFFVTAGDRADVLWRVSGTDGWQHSSIATDEDGLRPNDDGFISYTVRDLDSNGDYDFGAVQHQGCGSGETVVAVIVDGAETRLFPMTHWEWLQ